MSWGFPCSDPSVGQQECGAEQAPGLAEKRTPDLVGAAAGRAAPRTMTGLARVLRFVTLIVLALVCAHVGGGAASRSPAARARAGQSASARFVSRKIALSPHARHRVNAPVRQDVDIDAIEVDVDDDGRHEGEAWVAVLVDRAAYFDAWRRHALVPHAPDELAHDTSRLAFSRPFPRGPPA